MVAGQRVDTRLLERVNELYEWIESKISRNGKMAGGCKVCGNCCDFEAFDHRLFVTPPELLYLVAKLGSEYIKTMPSERCPYNLKGKCSIHEHRFTGCRIFCCSGDAEFQSELSESIIVKLKSICEDFQIPYRYVDLPTALNTFTGG